MFAIVQVGSHQFQVQTGDYVRIPYQNQAVNELFDLPVIAFGKENHLISDLSLLKESRVQALVLRQSRSRKSLVFKKKRRKGYRRTKGHRQKITEIRILELKSPDGEISKVESKGKAKTGKKSSIDKAETQIKTANKKQADKGEAQVQATVKKKPIEKAGIKK